MEKFSGSGVSVLSALAAEMRDASVFLLRIDEHAISLLVHTNGLHSAKAKQINAVQTPTPNAERHSGNATTESNRRRAAR